MEDIITSNEMDIQFMNEKSGVTSDLLNLPDLQFFHHCQEKYKLNKGVFNTIDNWFYNNGIVNIIHRRINILTFLQYVKECDIETNKFVKFGSGGLARKLNEFIKKQEESNYFI